MFDFSSPNSAMEQQQQQQQQESSWNLPDLLTSVVTPVTSSTAAINVNNNSVNNNGANGGLIASVFGPPGQADVIGEENIIGTDDVTKNNRVGINKHDPPGTISLKREFDNKIQEQQTTVRTKKRKTNTSAVANGTQETAGENGSGERSKTTLNRKFKQPANNIIISNSNASNGSEKGDRGAVKGRRMKSAVMTNATQQPNCIAAASSTDIRVVLDESTAPPTDEPGATMDTCRRSFHQFGQIINLYNLMSHYDREKTTKHLTLSPSEQRVCNGNVIRRRVREVFQMLCFGLNVHPDRMKMSLLEYFRELDLSTITQISQLTEKTMLRYIDYWYMYASEANCDWSDLTAEDIEQILESGTATTGCVRLGQACRSCVSHFLRLNHFGRLCPKLCSDQTGNNHTTATVGGNIIINGTCNDNCPSSGATAPSDNRVYVNGLLSLPIAQPPHKDDNIAVNIGSKENMKLSQLSLSHALMSEAQQEIQQQQQQQQQQQLRDEQLPQFPITHQSGGKNMARMQTVFVSDISSGGSDSTDDNVSESNDDNDLDDDRYSDDSGLSEQQSTPPLLSRDPRPVSKKS